MTSTTDRLDARRERRRLTAPVPLDFGAVFFKMTKPPRISITSFGRTFS